MSHEKLLEAIEQRLFDRDLNSCERYIFEKSWEGERYSTIAQEAGYDRNYIKQIGAKLWSELSTATGKNITKKNLRIVLNNVKVSVPETAAVKQRHPQPYVANTTQDLSLKFPSSPVAQNSSLYVNRPPNEAIACQEIEHPGCLLRIKGARKIGKSSLLNRILAHGTAKNYASVTVDFQEAESALYDSLDVCLQWFCASISYQLGLPIKLDEYWEMGIGSKVSCRIYLENYLLKQLDRPLILAINELNQLFEYPNLTRDFLSMLRFWHEQSKSDPLWEKLRLILVHSTDVYVSLNLNQSPFNVGLSLQLPLFDLEQTNDLAIRYGLDLKHEDRQLLEDLYGILNGHPYLTSLAFYHLQAKTIIAVLKLVRYSSKNEKTNCECLY